MNPRRILLALVAAAAFAASAAVCVVALAFALYAGVEPYLGRAGASGVVAGTAALFILFLALMLSGAARARPKPKTGKGATAENLVERAMDFIRDKPVVAIAAAIGVGILAVRNPQYFGAAIRAFVEGAAKRGPTMFKLPDLPFAYDALEPVISAETMGFHHDKHHAKYVETLNKLLDEAAQAPTDLEGVVLKTEHAPEKVKLFDNAAQAWNHAFFWTCMSPEPSRPDDELASAIESAFGGTEKLKALFVKEGAGHFGSGWVWLAADGAALKLMTTHDADDALTHAHMTPLLTCDLWEHAYYLDYQNERESFLEAWFDALPNWRFASAQYAAATGNGTSWRHPKPS